MHKNREWLDKQQEMSKCWVVTCIPCDHPFPELESPNGCCNCGMLDWLCFDTEEEANDAYKKQYPEKFNEKGEYNGK